jgi:hypothetical protein
VSLVVPVCQFANFVLWNRYLQTFNYAQRQISLNRRQVHGLDSNLTGTITLIISPRRPVRSLACWLLWVFLGHNINHTRTKPGRPVSQLAR